MSGSIPEIRPTPRGGIGHTATCIQGCRYAWLAGSSKGIEVVDLRDPRRPRFAGVVPVGAAAGDWGTHDVQVDSTGLAWVAGSGGTAAYDVSAPAHPRLVMRTNRRGEATPWNDLIHHNSLRISGSTLLVTEEDIRGGCGGAGSFQTWEVAAGGRARPLDRFEVERDRGAAIACSAHYFDHRDGLVAAGFFQQGVRFLDVRDPSRITQVGYYKSGRAMVWGALYAPTDPAGEVVYVLDHARGIDVIEVERGALAPVRRPASLDRGRGLDVGAFVSDRLEVARPGQRIRVQMGAGVVYGRGARAVRMELQLPPEVRLVRLPRGARFDRSTRRVLVRVPNLRTLARRAVIARVRRGARIGARLDLIAYARARGGDLMPLTDRWVDQTVLGRRTRRTMLPGPAVAAAAGSRFGVCVVGLRR